MSETRSEERSWPLRALLLLALGALAGLAVHWLVKGAKPWEWTDSPLRLAAASSIAMGFVAFAFSLERVRWTWSILFSLLVGLVVGSVTWSNGPFGGWGANEGWQLFSALLAVAIAVPLFQTARDQGRVRFDYPMLHAHSWTNLVLWCASWGFVLVTWLLALLLVELFNLIGIHQLRDLLNEPWFDFMLDGGAFGLAAGLFRDRDRVLETLQRVVTAILAVLTPVLAVGLVLFVLFLPFTGLEPLWSQTKQTTPILLVCILGAFLLVNATIGPEEEPRAAWLRHSAMALAAVMLPLGIVAAVSLGKRIGQYGFTPERLWAAVFVLVAIATGLLYLGAIARRRLGWAVDVRRANIGLAIGVCALALFLALPLISFGAISANDQVRRLQSGKVSPDKFDWAALRFDFGPAGQRAVARLARQAPQPKVRQIAADILARRTRYEANEVQTAAADAARPLRLKTFPPVAIPTTDLQQAIRSEGGCTGNDDCLLFWKPGEATAILVLNNCPVPAKGAATAISCSIRTSVLQRTESGWSNANGNADADFIDQVYGSTPVDAQKLRDALNRGNVEIREVKRWQVFVGGEPQGEVFVRTQSPAK